MFRVLLIGDTMARAGRRVLEERLFEIASQDPEHPLTEHKARGVAEALKRQDMFDEISVEPREFYEEESEPAFDEESSGADGDPAGEAGQS